ncbi:MAG: magnesium transporter [Acidobacteria bacterium]|nr:magnesium transporter [Acidobacteriota bacterium]MDA1234050.1 magnesium transporter [Acidobacteriota bacterium]
MPTASAGVAQLLVEGLFAVHPEEAADELERLPTNGAIEVLTQIGPAKSAEAFRRIAPATEISLLEKLEPDQARDFINLLDPPQAGALLAGLKRTQAESILGSVSETDARQLRQLMEYPADSAGRLMDPRVALFRPDTVAQDALSRLRSMPRSRKLLNLWVVDPEGRLSGAVSLQDAALAQADTTLSQLDMIAPMSVSVLAKREEVVETMERNRMASIPVVDYDQKPIGIIRLNELVSAIGKEHSPDLVSMTGASKEERALSTVRFAVSKRLPWLQINLATAFLAASVVGLFEETISQFTALAVLLPVVAGQSGNTGAQALAVVLRGLALREITLRHWPEVAVKEFFTGLLNGLAVAVVTCIGVYIWSGSIGLVAVIGVAMIFSMAIAGVAGAIIPVILAALGQDPAQSSSIVLTTVTDVFGFFSFLGLATLFASAL